MMEEDFYKKLCLAVYRVTELFPEGEPLKMQIREIANKILADLISDQHENLAANSSIINHLFDVAEAQDWIDGRNFLVLKKEYQKLGKLGKKQAKADSGKTGEKPLITQNRKEIILNVLQEKKKIRLKDLIDTFPQVSKRTLMRDMEELYRSGVIVKIGNGPSSCYNIKS